MYNIAISDLVASLKSNALTMRTGILLLPRDLLTYEGDLSVGLGIGHCNICTRIVDGAIADRKMLGITRRYLFDVMDSIVNDEAIQGKCILVSGLDILLAALKHDEVIHFWKFFRDNYRRDRGVLLTFPSNATSLLSSEEIRKWNAIERIAKWEEQ